MSQLWVKVNLQWLGSKFRCRFNWINCSRCEYFDVMNYGNSWEGLEILEPVRLQRSLFALYIRCQLCKLWWILLFFNVMIRFYITREFSLLSNCILIFLHLVRSPTILWHCPQTWEIYCSALSGESQISVLLMCSTTILYIQVFHVLSFLSTSHHFFLPYVYPSLVYQWCIFMPTRASATPSSSWLM